MDQGQIVIRRDPDLDTNQSSSSHVRYMCEMLRSGKGGKSRMGLLVAAALLLLPSALQAEDPHSEHIALLAIHRHKERIDAGMMCVGSELGNVADIRSPSKCEILEIQPSGMCRPSSSSILNPNVLAFDVTQWPRQAVANLVSRIRHLDDPLAYDFAKTKLMGLQVRRIEETQGDDVVSQRIFEFSSGCYLLMIVPDSAPAVGS
jgi:hypothetical protein